MVDVDVKMDEGVMTDSFWKGRESGGEREGKKNRALRTESPLGITPSGTTAAIIILRTVALSQTVDNTT
jgi:hypothetical protein